MLLYTQRDETWPITKMELEGRGVSKTPASTSGAFIGQSLHQLVSSRITLKLIRGCFVLKRLFALALPAGGLYELL